MDKELEAYTEHIVSVQTYRNGIFGRSLWDRWMSAVAFYRAGVDQRGALQSRRTIRMDAYLERYVDETMNAQVTRNGIFARRSFTARVRSWLGMN